MEPRPWSAPDDEQNPLPLPSRPPNTLRRAAILVWIVGGLEVVFCGCCSVFYGLMALVPLETLEGITRSDPATSRMLAEAYPALQMVAVVMLLLGFLPGVAYIVLGFGVRRGQAMSISVTLLILLTQSIVVGVLLLAAVATTIQAGLPAIMTAQVLLWGTPLALLLATLRELWLAKQYPSGGDAHDRDPWDTPRP